MSCDSPEPARVWPAKDPDSKLDYYVDFQDECARRWSKDTTYSAGERVRPARPTGFEYESSGGRSGTRPPIYPEAIGQTARDGSIVWTCRALSSQSLRRTIVGVPTWTAPSELSMDGQAIGDTVASANLAGGVDGEDYTVLVNALFSDGNDITATCILPVRRPKRVCIP